MAEERGKTRLPHTIFMDCRKKLTLTGISDVGSFDEQGVILYSDYGEINVKGSKLHINMLSLDTSEVSIDGEINSIIYTGNTSQKSGVFSKIFR